MVDTLSLSISCCQKVQTLSTGTKKVMYFCIHLAVFFTLVILEKIEMNIHVNFKDLSMSLTRNVFFTGFTPLILAATAGHVDVVEILLESGADMEAQSERTKDTPLSLACSGGRYEVNFMTLYHDLL